MFLDKAGNNADYAASRRRTVHRCHSARLTCAAAASRCLPSDRVLCYRCALLVHCCAQSGYLEHGQERVDERVEVAAAGGGEELAAEELGAEQGKY